MGEGRTTPPRAHTHTSASAAPPIPRPAPVPQSATQHRADTAPRGPPGLTGSQRPAITIGQSQVLCVGVVAPELVGSMSDNDHERTDEANFQCEFNGGRGRREQPKLCFKYQVASSILTDLIFRRKLKKFREITSENPVRCPLIILFSLYSIRSKYRTILSLIS